MEIWQLIALGIVGYLGIGFVVEFCAMIAVSDFEWNEWSPVSSKQFFREMIASVQDHPGEHLKVVLGWLLIFLGLLCWFLYGGISIVLSRKRKESAN